MPRSPRNSPGVGLSGRAPRAGLTVQYITICSYTRMLSILTTHRRLARALAVATIAAATTPAAAQEHLNLRDALRRAGSHAVANRVAAARQEAAAAGQLATRRAVLPTVRVEGGFLRTTDPVATFGTSLRQQRITTADFDPQRLNFPSPTTNFAGALILEQPVLALDGWMAARAGARAATAARHGATWTAVTTQVDVITAYYGATLAASHAASLAAATNAARAHVRQANAMRDAGLVTKSDALLAATRAASLEAARLDASRDSVLAIRRLTMLLGADPARPVSPAAGFPADSVIERAAHHALTREARNRGDVDGAQAAVGLAEASVARSRAAFLPRVVSFARQDLNSSARPFAGASSWTVGIMASWAPFSGAAELADLRGAEAQRAEARAHLEGAAANAAIDLERSQLTLSAALARLDVMRTAAAQAAEAHRIVTRKYEGGLASVAELLDAFSAETEAGLMLSTARYGVLAAIAERLRALGLEPAGMAELDSTSDRRPEGPTP